MRALILMAVFAFAVGCGVAARPISSRGAESVEGIDTSVPRAAWFLCERTMELPARVVRLASYRKCHIVVSEPEEHATMQARAKLALGPAIFLEKTDPALLVKALARDEVLHIVLSQPWHEEMERRDDFAERRWREQQVERYEALGLRLVDEIPCPSRGYDFDLDCRPEQISDILASRRVFELTPWTRWFVRWK